jgi:hypothetical protein
MRLPRVRLTIWGMMIIVAVAGFLVWSIELRRLAASHHLRALGYERRMHQLQRSRLLAATRLGDDKAENPSNAFDRAMSRRIHHLQSLMEKYERAARYPWLPVEPDPTEPE